MSGRATPAASIKGETTQYVQSTLTHARHGAHGDRYIWRIGELDADVGDWGTEWSHRKGHDIHRSTLHDAGEVLEHLGLQLGRIAPIVGGAGIDLVLAGDERAVLDAGHVRRIG
jgi:hypothetical protein